MSLEWVRLEQNIYGEGLSVRSHAQAPYVPSNPPPPLPSGRSGPRTQGLLDEAQYDLPSSWRKSIHVHPRGHNSTMRRVGGGTGRRTRSETNLLLTKALAPPETKLADLCPLLPTLQSYYKSQTLEFTVQRTRPPTLPTYALSGILLSLIPILMAFLDCGIWFLVVSTSVLSVLAFLRLNKLIVQENLLLIATFGVQISQLTVLGTSTGIKFIPITNIKAVVINETIKMQRVITYIALILHAPDANGRVVIPVFQETLPRLRTLETIYRGIFNVLNK